MTPTMKARLLSAAATLIFALVPASESVAAPGQSSPTGFAVPGPVTQGAWSVYYTPPAPVPSNAPSIRVLHTTIYDPAGDRTVMFGGLNSSQAFNDAWSLSPSGVWSPLAALGAPPSPRRDHTSIYDSVRGRMIVFGG